jgi:CDP-diacylglycerol--serine O-phosphatidyltransferase
MISHVLYPALPTVSIRSIRRTLAALVAAAVVVAVLFHPYSFAFPALVAYIVFGLAKTFFLGLLERVPAGDPLYEGPEDEDEDVRARPVEIGELPGAERRRRRRGRRRGARPSPLRRHIDREE